VTTLLLGGGLLGSGFRELLGDDALVRLSPPWRDEHAVDAYLRDAVPAAVGRDDPTLLVWAAGVGHVGAGPDALQAEGRALDRLCDVVAALDTPRGGRLTFLFASSAGALFGGYGDALVAEDSEPAPATPYGHEKLRQERAVAALADGGCRVVALRYTNLYGLTDGRVGTRGLIQAAVRATRARRALTVYVSPDTRRDLVYNRDAAAAALALARDAPPGFSARLVADGRTRTISSVLSLVGRLARHRVPVTYAHRPETRVQPRVLRFAPAARICDLAPRTPIEAAIHRMLRAPATV
jgi:UDP-glucose 4-epimerase